MSIISIQFNQMSFLFSLRVVTDATPDMGTPWKIGCEWMYLQASILLSRGNQIIGGDLCLSPK